MADPNPAPVVPNQPAENPLPELIPYNQRKRVYALFGLVGLIFGALCVAWGATASQGIPDWLVICVVVYNFLGVPFAALAGTNVKAP